jgi:hypothetical protein
MKRTWMFVACLAVVAFLWPEGDEAGVPLGAWHGKTSQGLSISFHVVEEEDGLVLEDWRTRVDLTCEETRRVLHGVVSGPEVPIHDGVFSADFIFPGLWHRFAGRFSPAAHARGTLTSVWPVLTGEVLEDLGTEKCTALELGWTAQPGEADEAGAEVPLDFIVRVGRDGSVSISMTTEWKPPHAE